MLKGEHFSMSAIRSLKNSGFLQTSMALPNETWEQGVLMEALKVCVHCTS